MIDDFEWLKKSLVGVEFLTLIPEPLFPTIPIFSLGKIVRSIEFNTNGKPSRYLILTLRHLSTNLWSCFYHRNI